MSFTGSNSKRSLLYYRLHGRYTLHRDVGTKLWSLFIPFSATPVHRAESLVRFCLTCLLFNYSNATWQYRAARPPNGCVCFEQLKMAHFWSNAVSAKEVSRTNGHPATNGDHLESRYSPAAGVKEFCNKANECFEYEPQNRMTMA